MSIRILGNYEKVLRDSRPTRIIVSKQMKKGPKGQAAPIISQEIIIPPINTDIRLSALPAYKPPTLSHVAMAEATKNLPETWDWGHNYSSDTSEIKQKKKWISPPADQKLCGSCWAFSTAGIVGDCFVTMGLVQYNPDLSPTYALACYPQSQCAGGNPATLFQNIADSGLATNHCIDYSWCANDEMCSGTATKHFDIDPNKINQAIPNCGCYYPDNHLLFFVEDVEQINLTLPPYNNCSDQKCLDFFRNTVKKHIYDYGPVLGAYIVLDNFMTGNFEKSGGVYLDTVDYTNSNSYFLQTKAQFKGGHSVAILGWGVAKNIRYLDNGKDTTGDVPYWIVRNSWTEKWGDKGYFKIAMYPYNQTSAFDTVTSATDSSGVHQLGGIIMFKAKSFSTNSLEQVDNNSMDIPKLQPTTYYQTEPQPDKSMHEKVIITLFGSDHTLRNFILFLLVIALIVGGIYYYKHRKIRRKSRK